MVAARMGSDQVPVARVGVLTGVDARREDWLVREQFRVARVASLPYAHNPSNCTHYEGLFDKAAEWDGAEGRRFFESLSAEQLAFCYYDQLADWRLVADASVTLFRTFESRTVSELQDAIETWSLPSNERNHVFWIFADPIVWGDKEATIINGQHRLCAIRASGAILCVIDHNQFDPYTSR